jgi:hypothetical protein
MGLRTMERAITILLDDLGHEFHDRLLGRRVSLLPTSRLAALLKSHLSDGQLAELVTMIGVR